MNGLTKKTETTTPQTTTPTGGTAMEATNTPATPRAFVAPPLDIFQNDDGWLVLADVPGVSIEDVDVNLHESRLSIEARRAPVGEGKVHFGAEPLVTYRRTLVIPDGVDPDGIEAKLHDGILEVRLARDQRTRARSIPVRSA